MRFHAVFARAVVAAVLVAASANLGFAGPIAATDFVVLRLGTGAAPLPDSNSASTTAFLDVYNLTTGSLSQSIQLDGSNFSYTNGPNRDGIFQLSQNGQSYSIGGYNAPAGTANPVSSSGRTIAQISVATGAVDYSTQFPSNGNAIRSVASKDGSQLWVSSDGSAGAALNYVPFGNAAATPATSISNDSSRAVNVANNQLYTMSGSSGFRGIGAISGGLPTSGPTTTTYFTPAPNPGSGPGVSSIFFADANTIYAAGTSNTAGDDFREYHFEGGSWVLKAAIASPGGGSSAYGIFSLPDPAIPGNNLVYMSTFSHIYKVSDNPNDGSFPALSSAFITLGANEQFRGLAPSSVPEPSTLALAGLGIAGFFAARMRRARRTG